MVSNSVLVFSLNCGPNNTLPEEVLVSQSEQTAKKVEELVSNHIHAVNEDDKNLVNGLFLKDNIELNLFKLVRLKDKYEYNICVKGEREIVFSNDVINESVFDKLKENQTILATHEGLVNKEYQLTSNEIKNKWNKNHSVIEYITALFMNSSFDKLLVCSTNFGLIRTWNKDMERYHFQPEGFFIRK